MRSASDADSKSGDIFVVLLKTYLNVCRTFFCTYCVWKTIETRQRHAEAIYAIGFTHQMELKFKLNVNNKLIMRYATAVSVEYILQK